MLDDLCSFAIRFDSGVCMFQLCTHVACLAVYAYSVHVSGVCVLCACFAI